MAFTMNTSDSQIGKVCLIFLGIAGALVIVVGGLYYWISEVSVPGDHKAIVDFLESNQDIRDMLGEPVSTEVLSSWKEGLYSDQTRTVKVHVTGSKKNGVAQAWAALGPDDVWYVPWCEIEVDGNNVVIKDTISDIQDAWR
ncbi:MAG: hypothetical protein AAGI37_14065 [Planctomycetota bacterium]